MALSLLQGYSTPSEASDEGSEGSDESDDGVIITIDRGVLQGKRPHHQANQPRKVMRGRRRDVREEGRRREERRREEEEVQEVVKEATPEPVVSTLDMPHFDLGQEQPEKGSPEACVPLPRAINDMFLQQEVVEDDPALHEGRTRSFAHSANSWASYVHIDLSSLDLQDATDLLVKELDLEPITSPHLSLSKVVSLRHHWLPPLTSALRHSLGQERRFHLGLDRLQVYVNDEGTRTFVGLTAGAGWPQLTRLSGRVDSCLAEYNLPPFWRPPSYHVSLGWCLGDRRAAILPRLQKLNLQLVDCLDDEPCLVTTVRCKAGNKAFTFNLI